MRLDIDFEPIVYLSIQTDSSWSPRTFLGVGTRVGNKKTSDGKQPIRNIPILHQQKDWVVESICCYEPHDFMVQPCDHSSVKADMEHWYRGG